MIPACRTRLLGPPTFRDAGSHRERRILLAILLAVIAMMTGMPRRLAAEPVGSSNSSGQAVDFSRDVTPIFRAYCVKCHGSEKPQAQLRLDSETAVLRGGVSGRVVVPGKSSDSLLIKRVLGFGDIPRMPLNGDPLPTEKINLIRAWIDQGAALSEPMAASQPGAEPQPAPAHAQSAAESSLFVAKIRPILAARCYQCHGPEVQQNGLRLDSLAAALKGSVTGKVILPGDGEKSPLIRRLFGLERPQMPYGGPPLAADQIALIRRWIDQGAPGPDSTEAIAAAAHPLKHWAYVKPVRPDLPPVKDAAWCRNPIDRFVLARLEKDGLTPSPEADKVTLIRRLSLDLIGLPPTIQEVDNFLADRSPEAYDKVVDRLLASPHYGEKWARLWLDLARYADTHGYEKDPKRSMWPYRDWVINAFNANMPFDEFTVEQIAGDMLPNATEEQKVASGFHRNTMFNTEGGVDPEQSRVETIVDRVNTTATVWLGSTLACAQCHSHKYDPFTQKEYYQFFAFFNNADEPKLKLPSEAQKKQEQKLTDDVGRLEAELKKVTPELTNAE